MMLKYYLFIVVIGIKNTYSTYVYDRQSIVFPNYNVVFLLISENQHQPTCEDVYYIGQEEKQPDTVYVTETDQYYEPQKIQYPIITKNPISLEKPCIEQYLYENPQETQENYNLKMDFPNTHQYKSNILGKSNPRSILESHAHIFKSKKLLLKSKVLLSNKKNIIDHDHGGHTNIHKNIHIHVHNRNAQPKNVEDIIGSHLFAAPRWRRSSTRTKRGIVDITKLVVDPQTKLDFQKTSENVGTATRNIFEEDYSPVYHLTNALGAAQDTFHSFMNVKPAGILIPCSYRIVHSKDIPTVARSPLVGSINPAIYSMHNQTPQFPSLDNSVPQQSFSSPGISSTNFNDNQYMDYSNNDPLVMIGDRLKESVQWAQKSVGHAADAIHHARQMITTARKGWPKVMLPYLGAVEVTKTNMGHGEIVGTAKDPEFVSFGRMMDGLGMTDRKLDISPRVGKPQMIFEEEMILKKAKEILGEPSYRSFLNDMKKHLDIPSNSDLVGQPRVKPNTDLRTRLALERLRSTLMLQKAKADLKKLQAPKVSKPQLSSIPKPVQPIKPINPPPLLKSPVLQTLNKNPITKLQPINPLLKDKLTVPKLNSVEPFKVNIATLNKNPTLKQPLIQPINSPENANKDILKSPLKIKSSNPILEKIRAAIETAKIAKIPPITIATITTNKPTTLSPLEKLREKLYEKYNIPRDNKDHSDILGKTLSVVQNPETVAATQNGDKDPVPVPVLTKEMKTPFMGLATKQDLEQYFKKLYCASCKMGDIN